MNFIAIPEYRLFDKDARDNNEITKSCTGEAFDTRYGIRISARILRDGSGAVGCMTDCTRGIHERMTADSWLEIWMTFAAQREQYA